MAGVRNSRAVTAVFLILIICVQATVPVPFEPPEIQTEDDQVVTVCRNGRNLQESLCEKLVKICIAYVLGKCIDWIWQKITVRCDPILTGFDGKEFHYNEVGDFSLLSEGDGWQVEATFAGATVYVGEELKETSWTTSVRILDPNGNMVSCALPAIMPNTSVVQMTAVASASSNHTILSGNKATVEFEQMSAKAVVTEGPASDVWACVVTTPKLKITVYQVWGWKQALIAPEMEGWATPFTWLNTDLELLQPLTAPVTGILGATYPVHFAAEQTTLRPDMDTAGGAVATIEGDGRHGRQLASVDVVFPLSAGVAGL